MKWDLLFFFIRDGCRICKLNNIFQNKNSGERTELGEQEQDSYNSDQQC